ncbi:MAG: hypothetical protein LBC04_02570 [Holosporaceae bacterium]|jgi:transposase-like protein|nr:hypothetical protein [Holosporaceae bacterium]
MTNCKRCSGDELSKRGFIGEKQRYLCKVCGMDFREGDGRERHPEGIRRQPLSYRGLRISKARLLKS